MITTYQIYYIYCNLLERSGFHLLAVPEDEYGIRTDMLRKSIEELGEARQEIRFVYIVTVNNPTSIILSNDRRRELVRIVTELSECLNRKIQIIFDKAYEDLIHDPLAEVPESGFLYDDLGIVYEVGTLSKVLAPALRTGYMTGAWSAFISTLETKKNSRSHSSTHQIPKYQRLNPTQNRYQSSHRNILNFAFIPRCRGKVLASHRTTAPRFSRF